MPLIQKEIFRKHGWFASWKVTETADELFKTILLKEREKEEFQSITHPARKKEWLAMRSLLKEVMPELELGYAPTGKPVPTFPGGNISLSHTSGIVAAIYHPFFLVGLDLQAYSDKLYTIRNRFIHPDEFLFLKEDEFQTGIQILWCAKEALFKCYGSGINFKEDIRISPFAGVPGEVIYGRVLRYGRVFLHQLSLQWFDDILCVYVTK